MKTLLTFFLIIFSINSYAKPSSLLVVPIDEVYDGDTIKTHMHWYLPEPLDRVSIRIRGIDTPEMPAKSYAKTGKLGRAKCIKEAELALKAKAVVVELTNRPKYNYMILSNYKWGKYGGRIIADVNIHDVNVAELLISKDLAVKYNGRGKKKDWCAK